MPSLVLCLRIPNQKRAAISLHQHIFLLQHEACDEKLCNVERRFENTIVARHMELGNQMVDMRCSLMAMERLLKL